MTFGRLENSLKSHLSNSKGRISISEFLTFIIERLSTWENAGIIRATLKLGATEPGALQPYCDFREYVSATAENMFKSGAKKKIHTKGIRGALQIVFASLNDAALMPKSVKLKLGSNEMKNALCKISAGHIHLSELLSGFLARFIGSERPNTAQCKFAQSAFPGPVHDDPRAQFPRPEANAESFKRIVPMGNVFAARIGDE